MDTGATNKHIGKNCMHLLSISIAPSLQARTCLHAPDIVCCNCSIWEQNKVGKKADATWCISFNFVDLKHKNVFASCGGVRVGLALCLLRLSPCFQHKSSAICSMLVCWELQLCDVVTSEHTFSKLQQDAEHPCTL